MHMIAISRLIPLYTVVWFTGVSAYLAEEEALLQFAGQLSNFEVRYCSLLERLLTDQLIAILTPPSVTTSEKTATSATMFCTQAVAATYHWQGWGLDNNTLCPSTQISVTHSMLCEPGYPGGIDQASQSWTGVTCTPNGAVICLSLPSLGLNGNISTLLKLSPLQSLQMLNLANNSLTGIV